MAAKALGIVAVVVALAVGGYWHWSPYLAIHSMQSAADNRDADRFNRYVDYPKLRESLKGQFSAMLREKLGGASSDGNTYEQAGAMLGSMIGMTVVDPLVDALVRPEMVMRAMERGIIGSAANRQAPAADSESQLPEKKGVWRFERKTENKLIAYLSVEGRPGDKGTGFVFERSGFASWKLSGIRLPTAPR